MNNEHDVHEAILKKLHVFNWTGRLLTTAALGIGLLALVAGIVLAAANSRMVMPMERLLIQDYPGAATGLGMDTNNITRHGPVLTRDELDARHMEVTFLHGKELFLVAAAVVLVGLGTFLTLLLVILNRRVTLRQVNANLAQISEQIKAL